MIGTNRESAASTTLAFLFTDLEGSTRLWQQFPEAMKTVLARHDELVRAAVEGNDGHVVKSTGDGFHAAFASAQDGLSACIEAQQSLLAESWEETGPLRVRMGLHVGEAQPRAGDYYGTAVNRAARLMSAANGGQVLLSAAVASLVVDDLPDGVSLRDLGEQRLKDLQRPEHVFQLVHSGLPADFPAIASLNRRPNNLPSQPTLFVGRQAELGDIKDLLSADTVRLLTLTGPGGTGKTRLALQSGAELVDRFDDGTYFIDLAPIRDPNAVLAAIARTIGLSESKNGSMLDDLKGQMREKRMLLLLDNFEQVTAAAVQVAELLRYCPRLKLLTTSREALHVRGEHLYPVPPLGLPKVDTRQATPEELARFEAVQLFVERAQSVKPGFELTEENAEAIADLCLRLDGLPLAIELAAARTRLFSPQALRQRLGNRLKLLRGGARDLPERQQTLRDTIDWSYELLAEDEKTLFQVVSVFSSCTFEAVEAVAGEIERLDDSDLDVVEGLVSLVDKSLIRLSEEGALSNNGEGEPRLRMLETIREYAAERLKADPELHRTTCQAHAGYFADFAQRQWRRMVGSEREAAMAELAADVKNLQIAWHYWVTAGDLEPLQKMVDGLWLLYDGRGWYQATVELTSDLLELLSTTPSSPEQARQEIMLQTSLARALMVVKGYTPEVEAAYTRALKLSEGQGEIPQLFPVLRGLSSFYMYRAEFDKGAQIGERILELAESRDDDYLRLHGYLVLGANTGFRDSHRDGLEILDKGIALFEREQQSWRPFQLGNNPGIVCYTTSAFFLWWLGYPERALERADRAMELATKLNHPFTMAYALFHTGSLHMWRGEMELAKERAEAMWAVAEEHGFQIWQSLAPMLLGATQTALGQTEEGLAKLEGGFALYQGLKSPPVFFPQLISMWATAFAQAGQPAEGLKLLDDSLLKDLDEERLGEQPQLLLLKGELLLATSPENRAEAAGIFRQALTVAQATGVKMLALQAATRLCQLEMGEGKAEESGRILAEIYEGFTEGFETADLRQARAVLDAWRG
jgi:predicted ATPase/class 3 adenylate cyclase